MFNNRTAFILSCFLFAAACSPISNKNLTRTFRQAEIDFSDHTGFMLYDLKANTEVYNYNGAKYFTPASNTKIFTLYTGLVLLGDSIPALRYIERGDSLIFEGTGDPSFLYHNVFNNDRTWNFLKSSSNNLYFTDKNFFTTPLGSGWAWSDYNYSYSSERSSFPIYGNIFRVKQKSNSGLLTVTPSYFKTKFYLADSVDRNSDLRRDLGSNRTDYFPGKRWRENEWEVPFQTTPLTIIQLLADTLRRPVHYTNETVKGDYKTFYSIASDSLYKVMMQESDNFIAEQLLLMSAGVVSDSLKPEIAIKYMKENHLTDLPDKVVWVDGSGLSRYNLFTPRNVVALWRKIYQRVPQDRLFNLLAIGGKAGTIRNQYKNDPPYIFGKTGTLSNNHSLSGYLVTKSGKILVFSFMSNNYVVSSSEIRQRMEVILRSIYENYK